jgi:hypothetical protein
MRDLTLFLIQFQSLRFACRLKGNNNTFFAFESLFRYFDSRFNLVRNTKIFSKTLMRGPNKTQHSLCHFCITLRMNPVLNQFESLRFACRLQIDDDTFFTCYSLFSLFTAFSTLVAIQRYLKQCWCADSNARIGLWHEIQNRLKNTWFDVVFHADSDGIFFLI